MEDKGKILIIDDEEIVLDSCTSILANRNYTLATANNGSEGITLLKNFQPDLVFVDLKMPGISGFEVLDKIFEFDPTIVRIVITGFSTVDSAVEAMKKGAYDFLPKPFTPDEFRLITKRGIERRKLVLETIALRKEKELLREHFAAIVSHELKSPLNAVQQNLYVLADELSEVLTEEQSKRLDRMKSRINDLMKQIHKWLRIYSVDIEKIRDTFEPVSVNRVVTKAVESVTPQAIRKDTKLVTHLDETTKKVNGDEGSLIEALANIIGNAIKYSRVSSQILVNVTDEIEYVSIAVADSGVGIPEEDIPHLFDDFFSGTPGPGEQKGSGIGLAITNRIIKAHDGSILVESEMGKGSTFIIKLPTQSIDTIDQTSTNVKLENSF